MKKKLNAIDVKILECLGTYGPRNINLIAEKLGISWDTVNYRLERLSTLFSFLASATVHGSNIGFRTAFLLVKSSASFRKVLQKCVKANDYWRYMSQIYGKVEGVFGVYTIPLEHTKDFIRFFHLLKSLRFIEDAQLYWVTGFLTINPSMKWFDIKSGKWLLRWKEWLNEIPHAEAKLPPILKDPENFPLYADYIDIFILSKLEANVMISFKEIAQQLGLTPPAIQYHYNEHVLKRGLISKWAILIRRFESDYDRFIFFFKFKSEEDMARFASSIQDKPFSYSISRIYGENTLITQLIIPSEQFRAFLESLSKLLMNGYLQSYDYLLEDYTKAFARTIPEKNFRNDVWIYNHKKHIRGLMKEVIRTYDIMMIPLVTTQKK